MRKLNISTSGPKRRLYWPKLQTVIIPHRSATFSLHWLWSDTRGSCSITSVSRSWLLNETGASAVLEFLDPGDLIFHLGTQLCLQQIKIASWDWKYVQSCICAYIVDHEGGDSECWQRHAGEEAIHHDNIYNDVRAPHQACILDFQHLHQVPAADTERWINNYHPVCLNSHSTVGETSVWSTEGRRPTSKQETLGCKINRAKVSSSEWKAALKVAYDEWVHGRISHLAKHDMNNDLMTGGRCSHILQFFEVSAAASGCEPRHAIVLTAVSWPEHSRAESWLLKTE